MKGCFCITYRTTNILYEIDDETQVEYATFSQQLAKDPNREKGETLIKEIVLQTNGVLCSFDEAMPKLMYMEKKQKRRMPWNCDLTIGSNVSIKIAAYIYVSIIAS